MHFCFQISNKNMVGLTNELPAFCFDRDELSLVKETEQIFDAMEVLFQTEFNVDAFVVKYKREVGLEKLRDDLDLFLRVLKSSMVELINRDFADFLNLSTNLVGRNFQPKKKIIETLIQVGFDKSITTLKNPLNVMKTDIMVRMI